MHPPHHASAHPGAVCAAAEVREALLSPSPALLLPSLHQCPLKSADRGKGGRGAQHPRNAWRYEQCMAGEKPNFGFHLFTSNPSFPTRQTPLTLPRTRWHPTTHDENLLHWQAGCWAPGAAAAAPAPRWHSHGRGGAQPPPGTRGQLRLGASPRSARAGPPGPPLTPPPRAAAPLQAPAMWVSARPPGRRRRHGSPAAARARPRPRTALPSRLPWLPSVGPPRGLMGPPRGGSRRAAPSDGQLLLRSPY